MHIPLYTLDSYYKSKHTPTLPLAIETLADLLPENIEEAHRHDYFQIIIAYEGSVNHRIEADLYKLKKGNVSVIFPRQIHSLLFSKDIKGSLMMFDEVMFCSELLEKELKTYSVDLYRKLNHIELTKEKHEEVIYILEKINKLHNDISPIRQEQIRFYIKILLLQLIEHAHKETLPKKNLHKVDIYSKYKTLIDTNYISIRSVAEYSSILRISPKKLNEICKEEAGMTALAVIHERIMVEIRRMFIYCSHTNKEIAYQLGFTSPSALNKFIFSQTGKTPTELRQSFSEMDK